ncbi:MAG: cytochrome c [Nitrospinota bacterium]
MKRYLFICFIFVFLVFGFVKLLHALSADEFLEKVKFTGKPVTKKGNPAEGREVYTMFCTNCHGEKGEGNGPVASVAKMDPKPKNHTDGKYMNERKSEDLFKVIKLGGKGVDKSVYMPAFGMILSEEEIWNLIAYLRTIAIPPYSGS